MHAYHGTTKTGLKELIPFVSSLSKLKNPRVYLSPSKVLATLHIWGKPYRWIKFEYAKDHIIWLEPYPGALAVFYGGVAGSIYACEGKFKRFAGDVIVSRKAVAVAEEERVPDALERILEYEKQGLLEIRRCEALPETKIIPMGKEHIPIVVNLLLLEENVKAALHTEETTRKEWEKSFRKNLRDKDEANFVLYRGNRPMGWLKLNGLNGDMAWISMLAIHPAHQNQGAGRFAVRYAEGLAREKGFRRMGIHTTADNAPARACYEKLGYTLTEENDRLTYTKEL